MDSLSSHESPSKVVLASLRALVTLVQVAALAFPVTKWPSFAEPLLSKRCILALRDILASVSHDTTTQRQVILACELLSWSMLIDAQRDFALSIGVLDALAGRLASFCLSQHILLPGANLRAVLPSLPSQTTAAMLPRVLSAISSIVHTSKYRLVRFLYSPMTLTVFPLQSINVPDQTIAYTTSETENILDHLLPRLPRAHRPSENGFSKAFPALGSIQANNKTSHFVDFPEDAQDNQHEKNSTTSSDKESFMVPWLLGLARSQKGFCRLQAARLLARIALAGFLSKRRDRVLEVLVVPLLVSMLDDLGLPQSKAQEDAEAILHACRVREHAPLILAELVKADASLQKAAVDAGAVKKLCRNLKQTFEPHTIPVPVWSLNASDSSSTSEGSTTTALGTEGLAPESQHLLLVRESSLHLLAALADKEDRYRKLLMEAGAVPCIVDSLGPFRPEILSDANETTRSQQEKFHPGTLGNYDAVLVAACLAARAMSRSVSLLRTSLIDCGLAKPILGLLKSTDVQVLIAATNVVCNLVTDFSPMRPVVHPCSCLNKTWFLLTWLKILIEAGVMKILCDHAHSADSRIRLVSLWALKHLVLQSPIELRTACLEELGTGWLMQIIGTNPASTSSRAVRSSTSPTLGAANAVGERINILNSVDEMDTEDNSHPTTYDEDDSIAFLHNAHLGAIAIQHRTYLRNVKAAEAASVAQAALRDEQQIQVQGLDFVRNLILTPGAPEMLDCIFSAVSAPRLFDMLTHKLRLPPLGPSMLTPGPAAPAQTTNFTLAPADILHASLFIVVHMAAGAPRHRQLLMAQTELLRAVGALLSHVEPRVRLPGVLALNNLTWVDSQEDAPAARARAEELRALGLEERLRECLNDECLDIREKAKTGVEQFRETLDGAGVRR